ncbi:conserved hypothetical protein [Sphingomonas sp. EC-HK361]|uniref:glycosyl transferase family 2 n=1 Tax=Sphingomonas sp. EC-HK361 TaxID=2038397 RepID=UPI00125B4C8F|nr:glycosyl transferase family 2 [Sphingomonas sp. EC-HK361]VVT14877.1 conserved hypothetical protein [Sphingomonas sp. EC-HK361]
MRNEQDSLPALIDVLANQARALDCHVIGCFYLDSCTDDSAVILENARARAPFEIRMAQGSSAFVPNAGRARRLAFYLGLAALDHAPDAVLLTTDADSLPAADWLHANLDALGHAEIVAGEIRQSDTGFSHHHARVERYFNRLHQLNRAVDPVPWEAPATHHYAGGASLAMTASTYAILGGFQDHPRGEDALLIETAAWHGLRVRRDARVGVVTSTRRVGRVDLGFAAHLRGLDETESTDEIMVADPRVAIAQYRRHAYARQIFRGADEEALTTFAADLGLSTRAVHDVHDASPNAEAFAMRVVERPDSAPLRLIEAEQIQDTLMTIYLR